MMQKSGSDHRIAEMLQLNHAQASFYDRWKAPAPGRAARAWVGLRGRLYEIRDALAAVDQLDALHREWLGDLSDKAVLDLGCYAGNSLSLYLAESSRSYLGIDLSETGISQLKEKLAARGLPNADAQVVDFLSPEFRGRTFDLVYARSVAHHFRYFPVFLDRLHDSVRPGGLVVTLDPLNTAWSVRIARGLYRPFQPDSAWEWPFERRNFEMIRRRFEIVRIQGVMGLAKWSLPLALFSRKLAFRVASRLHQRDWQQARQEGRALWRCLQVTMLWRRPA